MIHISGAGNIARVTSRIYEDLNKFDEIAGLMEENCKKNALRFMTKVVGKSIIGILHQDSILVNSRSESM